MKKTQVQSFRHINQKTKKRNQVLDAIRFLKGATLFEICDVLGWPVNCITGRVNELCKAELIKDSGKIKKNPKTNRSAIIWALNV